MIQFLNVFDSITQNALCFKHSNIFRVGYFCAPGFDVITAECAEGEIMIPNFLTYSWTCASSSDGYTCPGDFSVACPDEPVEASFESCQCDGQFLVNESCQTA